MFITIVRFSVKAGTTLAAITKLYEEYSKDDQESLGLLTTYYLFGDSKGGIVYVWKSREDAERLLTAEWLAIMGSRYGGEPEIEWLENPLTVDNLSQQYRTLALGFGP